jgi:aldehyde dehydrogenase (NAD+)
LPDMTNIAAAVLRLRNTVTTGHTREASWRRAQLQSLMALITEGEDQLLAALAADLGKSPFESKLTETRILAREIGHALDNLHRWMAPRRVPTPAGLWPARARVVPEPLGVVLVIAPWNYPVQLLLSSLISALAAGNTAMLKPSEYAVQTSDTVASLVSRYFDQDTVAIVQGGVERTTTLLRERFDHIVFTGGAHIGRIVMAAAANHLTPVTLELGGKSPCVVADDADLARAATRIVWGKFLNAGQTCVAPDYVLVQDSVHDRLVVAIIAEIKRFFGSGLTGIGRIVSSREVDRLRRYLTGARVVAGGIADSEARYFSPTVLVDVEPNSAVMQEEIFGPILPILRVTDIAAAIDFINARDKPLASYLFTRNRALRDAFLSQTSSGSVCINDVLLQLSIPDLPFGGVGASGFGRCRGEAGFMALSNIKSILTRHLTWEPPWRVPPYREWTLPWIDRLM